MGKIVLQMSMSADGLVSGPDGQLDWIFETMDDALVAWTVASLREADVHVMGHRTYRAMAAHWPVSHEPFAAPMNTTPKVVIAPRDSPTPWGPVEIIDGDLDAGVQRLRRTTGSTALVHGGVSVAQALIARGLVDEYRLRIHPVALGRGRPLFGREVPRRLRLIDAQAFPAGAMVRRYRPAG